MVAEEAPLTRYRPCLAYGQPAGVLIGFDSEEAWFDYRLEHHPEFLARIKAAPAQPFGVERACVLRTSRHRWPGPPGQHDGKP